MDKKTRAEERKRKRRYWQEHIASWRKSGMSQRTYCRKHDLKFHQLVYWRKKYHFHSKPAVSLVQISLTEKPDIQLTTSAKPVHLITKTGHRIELARDFDPVTLQQLLNALGRA